MTTQQYTTAPDDKIPLNQKIAFGIGMLGNQMFPAALGVFMVVLVQGLGMDPLLWGILFFLPRLLDALTDPVMGFVTDNTRSRWGRRRPYIFIGSIVSALSFMAMWQIYTENSQLYNFTWFLCISLVFYLGLTVFATPYVAMGYEMSNDYHERTRLMAVSQWIGQWTWVVVPWFWILIYNQSLFDSAAEGARVLAVWVGLLCLVFTMTPALFCKTQPVREEDLIRLSRDSIRKHFRTFLGGILATFKCTPFRKLCIATFFVFNAFNTIAGFSWFIIVYYMFNGDPGAAGTWPAWSGSVGALCTCFLVIPIVTWMAQRHGKRTTFMVTQGISIFGYTLYWWCFDPNNPWLLFIPLPLFAFGIGGLFTLMMSMTADVCDLDELENGSRREGMFGAIYWWMVKFGFAIAGLFSGLILKMVGFDQSVAVQSEEALTGLRLAYILLPIVGTLLAMFVMRNYDLSEQRAHDIREQLEARRGVRATG